MGRPKRKRKRKGEGPWARKRLQALRAAGEPLLEPRCVYTEACGGCTWQELAYERQLELKRELVAEAFRQERVLEDPAQVPLPLPSPETFRYRNKMEFSFGAQRFLTRGEIASGAELRRDFALGMFGPATQLKVVDLPGCPVQSEPMDRVLNLTREWALGHGLAPFVNESQTGFLRYLILRRSEATGEGLALLVTSSRDPELLADYVATLRAADALPSCVANGVRASHLPSSEGMEVFVDHGPGHYKDVLCGLTYEIAPDGFFQVNTAGAEVLIEEVLRQAELSGGERVLDLFCGGGTLSLPLARRAAAASGGEVVGYEVVAPAVESARRNAAANGLANTRFGVADLNHGVPREIWGQPFDLVVTDPPRAGMNLRTLRGLSHVQAPRLVAVGCKPGPLARNLAWLCAEAGYRLSALQPIDLFPHTPHVEVVATLVRD